MWRFVEEGPRLKFPLRISPFMTADPMYYDVSILEPIEFQRGSIYPNFESHSSFSYSTNTNNNTNLDNSSFDLSNTSVIKSMNHSISSSSNCVRKSSSSCTTLN